MKKYKVISPYVVFNIRHEGGKTKEYALKKGDTIDLPADNIAVRAMLVRKQLKELPTEQSETNKQVKTEKK